jgi:polyisoprenoid-binding protein YceI
MTERRKVNRMTRRTNYTGVVAVFACAALASSTACSADTAVYRVDPARTLVEYSIAWFGVLRQSGRFPTTQGTLALDLDARQGHVEITIDARSVETGFALRDAFVRDGAMLDTERYPAIVFESNRLVFADRRLARIDGRLTMHGVTHDVSLDVVRFDCGQPGIEAPRDCSAQARTTLHRSSFGMDAYAPIVDDDVTLTLAVVGHR